MARTIGYLGVSQEDQDLSQNRANILSLANFKNLGQVEWVEEKDSDTRENLARHLKHYRPEMPL
jgi:DNA invertase Pin-like site-specific DNA recombinase